MNQDWTPVVLDKRRGGGGGAAAAGTASSSSAPRRTGPSAAAKLDADTETFARELRCFSCRFVRYAVAILFFADATVDRSLSQAIQQGTFFIPGVLVIFRVIIQSLAIAARMAKKVTQKDLAQLLCVQPTVVSCFECICCVILFIVQASFILSQIAEYENGKAIPNGAFIAKLERALGAKLPRPPKK